MSIIFVHGITVREDRFTRLLKEINSGFGRAGISGVFGCYWGDLGRSPDYRGLSIPGINSGRRASDEHPGALPVEPLAELIALRDPEQFDLGGPRYLPVPERVEERNRTLSMRVDGVSERLVAASATFENPSAPTSRDRIKTIVEVTFAEAARADRTLDVVALVEPLVRANVTLLYLEGIGDDVLASEFRWNAAVKAVEDALAAELGGQRGLYRALASNVLTFGLRHGGRDRVMPGLSLFLGDVFAWYRNREEILERLEQAVADTADGGPLTLLGHSLGGVIAFDYALSTDREIRLITVGSQVGLFGELGVLYTAAQNEKGRITIPSNIVRWRNIYDPDDALAFMAAPVFEKAEDRDFDTHAPFPACHSEYWNVPELYDLLVPYEQR